MNASDSRAGIEQSLEHSSVAWLIHLLINKNGVWNKKRGNSVKLDSGKKQINIVFPSPADFLGHDVDLMQ